MKKRYEMPTIDVTRIETIAMIAVSLEKDGTVEITSEDDLLSRGSRYDGWDDEE